MRWGDSTAVPLTTARCRALLASTTLGTVALSMRALPMAFPVVFAVLDHDVIVRTSSTGSLLPQMDHQIVTLVAYEQSMSAGEPSWLVSVTGRAHAVEDEALLEACRALRLPECGSTDVYVRIPVDVVVGQEHPRWHEG